MGCDIYMHVQVKDEFDEWVWQGTNIYDGRDYTLFGILDGTRGTEFTPIAPNKGFPEDSFDKLIPPTGYDNEYVTVSGVYLGYCGVSYLNVQELLSFDWDQKVPGRDYMSVSDCSFCRETLPYLM